MASSSPLDILTDIVSTGMPVTFTQFIDIVRTRDGAQPFQGNVGYLNHGRKVAVLLCPPIRQTAQARMTDEDEATSIVTPSSCLMGQEVPSSETMSSLPSSCGSWIDGLSAIGVNDKLQINCTQMTTSNNVGQTTKPDKVPEDCLLPLVKKVSFSPTVTRFTYEELDDTNDEATCKLVQDQPKSKKLTTKLTNGQHLSATETRTTTDSSLERASKDTQEDVSPSVVSGTKRRRLWNPFHVVRGHQKLDDPLSTRKTTPVSKRKAVGANVRSSGQFTTTGADVGSQSYYAPELDAFFSEDDAIKNCLPPEFRFERSNRQWDKPLVQKGPPRIPQRKIPATKTRYLMSRFF
ncbi:hypothetical protein M404DRAFT_1003758 [Pisolithus tinctorius Marx 270]|uniref:Uncharacterized protein n=1 Tax=Pisolithus tinctorius Marx 270 TaxID=870435 RepID=A0A0C3IV55_PISTI|nr:hypothetical protein M404DRAFT_1003758 [Pisolithus tinctorius Marx 270]